MQLVLGLRIRTSLVTPAGAATPAPEPWQRGERWRRVLRRAAWSAVFALLCALGVLQGARVAIGADGVSALALGEPGRTGAGTLERDERRGTLWRPADSTAQRPASPLRSRRWDPERR